MAWTWMTDDESMEEAVEEVLEALDNASRTFMQNARTEMMWEIDRNVRKAMGIDDAGAPESWKS